MAGNNNSQMLDFWRSGEPTLSAVPRGIFRVRAGALSRDSGVRHGRYQSPYHISLSITGGHFIRVSLLGYNHSCLVVSKIMYRRYRALQLVLCLPVYLTWLLRTWIMATIVNCDRWPSQTEVLFVRLIMVGSCSARGFCRWIVNWSSIGRVHCELRGTWVYYTIGSGYTQVILMKVGLLVIIIRLILYAYKWHLLFLLLNCEESHMWYLWTSGYLFTLLDWYLDSPSFINVLMC